MIQAFHNFIEMVNLNKLTIKLNLYDNTSTLKLSNKAFKKLLIKELLNLAKKNKI